MINADTDSGELYTLRRVALIERDYVTVDAVNWELRRRHVRAAADRDYGHGHCSRCGATLTATDTVEAGECTQCGESLTVMEDNT